MKSYLKGSLLAIALIAAVAVQSGTAMGQEDFVGTVADIPQAADDQAAAYYDSATGDVIISNGANNGLISVFFTDAGFGGFGTITPTTISSPIDPAPALGDPLETGAVSFSYFDTAGLPVGIFNLGSILPAGSENAAAFRSNIANGGDSGIFFQPAGTNGFSSDIQVIGNAIPEPGSLSLLALAGLGLVTRRRRG